jgi:hypothetical protein
VLVSSEEAQGRDVDLMSREELIDQLLEFKDCTRTRFTRAWLDRQSTERLRTFVLAAQLYSALLHQAGREGAGR